MVPGPSLSLHEKITDDGDADEFILLGKIYALSTLALSRYSINRATRLNIRRPRIPASKTLSFFLGDTGKTDDVGSLIIWV